ncbi:hypothetical protein EST38_g14426, partial [Candolleomyces aberdarensis]
TREGELTVECPACPHPGKNLPDNWGAAGALLFLYTLFVAVDANFKLKGKARKINDVELTPGLCCFVEEEAFQAHLAKYVDESEINTCLSEHDAIVRAAVRCTPGYSVTGAGLVICSRHGLVRPNGAGDLHKGERYSNMDYIILSALKWILLIHVVITYDIACQWSKNLEKRMEKLPENICLNTEKTSITAAIPSWHINGHGSDCQTNYALAFRPGSGRTCGDEIESSWSQTNVLGASVREMASGGRHETLNDHFNGANIRKIVNLPAFAKLSATFSEELKVKWTRVVSEWERDPSKRPNPYDDVKLETTLQDVRLQLAKEDANEAARGAVSAHQMSTSTFLITGLELEEQQRSLKLQVKGNKMTTSKQKADLEDKRTALRRRINQWREVQLVYTSCVVTLLPSSDPSTSDVVVTAPEDIPLHLPSSLPANLQTTIPHLIKKEQRLREAQCDDALADIRRQRRILTGLVSFKKLNLGGQGNKPNTRVRSLYTRIQTKIMKAAMRYRHARDALTILHPNGSWSTRLQILKDEDIRGPGKEPTNVSSGRYIMSWIWLVPRAQNGELDSSAELNSEELDESLRVEWMKSRARLQRWEEECLLIQEEMRRAVVYLVWKGNWWRSTSDLTAVKLPDIVHGASAYAAKQASLCERLTARFSTAWEPVLNKLGYQAQWGSELVSGPVSSHQPTPRVAAVSTDHEIEDEDSDSDLVDYNLLGMEDEFDGGDYMNDFELDDD